MWAVVGCAVGKFRLVMSEKKHTSQFQRQKGEPINPKIGSAAPVAGDEAEFGKKGRIVMVFALALIMLGYILLKKVDPAGENIYAKLSPFALLSGYLLIPAALYVHKSPANTRVISKAKGNDETDSQRRENSCGDK